MEVHICPLVRFVSENMRSIFSKYLGYAKLSGEFNFSLISAGHLI
jgi:hypothetical protein